MSNSMFDYRVLDGRSEDFNKALSAFVEAYNAQYPILVALHDIQAQVAEIRTLLESLCTPRVV